MPSTKRPNKVSSKQENILDYNIFSNDLTNFRIFIFSFKL